MSSEDHAMSLNNVAFRLHKITVDGRDGISAQYRHNALYVLSGSVDFDGKHLAAGEGAYCGPCEIAGKAELLIFALGQVNSEAPERAILHGSTEFADKEAVLRLDQVTFPAKARAYRHVHAGAGIRYLVKGSLEVKSDHDTLVMNKGDAWFEGANSPVQATAAAVPSTSFVRVLLLPIAYEGKPTIQLLNREDETKPKLQTNKRHFDQQISLSS